MRTEMVRAHELAHQWFGNKVGWTSYHDQWISEAFANYAGAMYIEQKYKDGANFREVMDDARRHLLEHAPDGSEYDSIGPLWLGQRLSSTAAPNAYAEITYNKGTWVVHMLRMLMRGAAKDLDDAFLKMVREFLSTYNGRTASTWDLKRVAEKYMTKSMDLRGDRKLDWFFDDWVFGTGIPSYSVNYRVQPSARGGFVVDGRVSQTGVPESFIMPVPLYADDQLLGTVAVSDEEGSFRFETKSKPVRVTADPQQTILTTRRVAP